MIEQCSPVLAGLKAANLFRHECRDRQALYATVAGWNAQLNGRGIRLLVLKECPIRHWFLIYLYRPARLEAVLGRPEVRQFLQQEGYALSLQAAGDACQPLLAQLAGRLACDGDFPHEIGIFSGLPAGGCGGGLYPQPRAELHLLRLLESLRRPRRSPPPVCPAEQVHRRLSAAVSQRHPHPASWPWRPELCVRAEPSSIPRLCFGASVSGAKKRQKAGSGQGGKLLVFTNLPNFGQSD